MFIQIGLVPNTDWLKGTVELSKHGEIVVDARGQTSVPGVFAAGDATTVPFKQIIIAAGDGAKAALGRLRPPDPHIGAGGRGRGLGLAKWEGRPGRGTRSARRQPTGRPPGSGSSRSRSGRISCRMVVAISSIDLVVVESQRMPSRRIMASASWISSRQFSRLA